MGGTVVNVVKMSRSYWCVVVALSVGLVLTLAVSGLAWAMRVSPMVVELTSTGANSSARIEVGNVGSVALPFEVSITRIDFSPDGQILETPADEDFLVFPPQGLVPVNGRQMVRLQWVGDSAVQTSQAYYASIRQLPVRQSSDEGEAGAGANVTVLYNMKALVVVAPANARPDVSVEGVEAAMIDSRPDQVAEGQPAQQPGIRVTVVNRGNRYALMSGATWTIEGVAKDGSPFTMQAASGSELTAVIGVGYVAPGGGRRTFALPTNGVELDPARPVVVKFTR